MHKIFFYKAPNGREPVLDYMKDLAKKHDKDSRLNLRKMQDYVSLLGQYGTEIGVPYVKHIEGDIWELRPLRNRILFVGWIDGSFVLLHQFLKTTQKTPAREITKARAEFADLKGRNGNEE